VPSASEIISLWERGVGQPPLERALLLAAASGLAPQQLLSLPIGRRDACLLELRQNLFGSEATAAAICPRCSEALEFTLCVTDWLAEAPADAERSYEIGCDGFAVRFRLPDSSDLKAIASCGDAGSGKQVLLQRCVEHVTRDGVAVACEDLPEALVAEIGSRMAECDPLADIVLEMRCASCGHEFSLVFDIASFLWQELDALARSLLLEVHALARAYGWAEGEILAMSARRRQHYLALAG